MTNNLDASGIDAAAELARAAVTESPEPFDLTPATALVVRTVRGDERVTAMDLETRLPAPLRARGSVTLRDPSDFARYVAARETAQTTLFADDHDYSVTAVFNDHATELLTGWRDHTAVLSLDLDPDWQRWIVRDRDLHSQADFGEQLEELAHTIVEPDAATMLEIALSFSAHRSATFGRATRLDTGDVQLTWSEDTSASAGSSGHLAVPQTFTLRVAPFRGTTPVDVTARLRYRIRDGRLTIGYQLHRPDIVSRDAFADVLASIGKTVTAPLLMGTPPCPTPTTTS